MQAPNTVTTDHGDVLLIAKQMVGVFDTPIPNTNRLSVNLSEKKEKRASMTHDQAVNEIAQLEKNDERLKLNIGGKKYETYRSTFAKYPDTLLATMFSSRNRSLLKPDDKGEYFFDRNPKIFEIILEFYRTGRLMFNPARGITKEAILEEFDFFQINITEDDVDFCMGFNESSREKFGDRFKRIAVNRACVRNKEALERVLHLVLIAIYKAS